MERAFTLKPTESISMAHILGYNIAGPDIIILSSLIPFFSRKKAIYLSGSVK
jgi:hypothetical protein